MSKKAQLGGIMSKKITLATKFTHEMVENKNNLILQKYALDYPLPGKINLLARYNEREERKEHRKLVSEELARKTIVEEETDIFKNYNFIKGCYSRSSAIYEEQTKVEGLLEKIYSFNVNYLVNIWENHDSLNEINFINYREEVSSTPACMGELSVPIISISC